MFPPKSLGLVLSACVYAAATRQSLSNLHGACDITVDHTQYDLCPLFNDRQAQDGVVQVRGDFSPTIQTYYEISFSGPLNPKNGESAESQCPPGTWVCLIENYSRFEARFTRARPIAGDLTIGAPHTTKSSRLEVDAYHSAYNGELEIDLKGGMWRNQPQAAHFRFICDQHAQEPSIPTLLGVTAGTHKFEWSTPHACAKKSLSFETLEVSSPPGDNAESEGDENLELIEHPPVHHAIRNIMIVLAVVTSVFLGFGYLIRYPPPQVKQWVGVTAKKLPFRVGETILVQWAQEAMLINDEEDVMVNYEEEDDRDEYIPLKSSPTRLSARLMDYGSARR